MVILRWSQWFASRLFDGRDETLQITTGAGLIIAVAWFIATVLMLPHRWVYYWRWTRPLWYLIHGTQWLWIAAFVIWQVQLSFAPAGSQLIHQLHAAQVILRLIAFVGVIGVAIILAYAAEEAELNDTYRRLNFAVWFLPISTALAWFLTLVFDISLGNISMSPQGLVKILFILPAVAGLVFWTYTLYQFISGIGQLRTHSYWLTRHVEEAHLREERVAAKRAAIDRDVEKTIRPTTTERKENVAVEERAPDTPPPPPIVPDE